ncbi:thioredoxin, partial [Salmonella sp. s51228]|uniref:thioredoxin n=1 Tax=Salmonella sp. s51228 TaxID=3159652 RepID=UPI00397FB6DD
KKISNMSVIEVETLAAFEEIIKGNKNVAVDFYATWCGPCKMISPKFESLSSKYPDVKFIKIDVDKNTWASEKYGISAMPTFLFFKDDARVGECIGASEEKIIEELERLH